MDITWNAYNLYLRYDSHNRKYMTKYTVDCVDLRIYSLIEIFVSVFNISRLKERHILDGYGLSMNGNLYSSSDDYGEITLD